ncbi:hypothetical protein M0R45_008079 [Rubus argutus]|uniref:Uncharacterized protein n=1 Tax=Rubus argutus TaxID=59490 RepID=A0AAW1Y0I3_RUBAR
MAAGLVVGISGLGSCSLVAIFLFISNPARGALNGGIVAALNKAHGWARVNDGVGLGLWYGDYGYLIGAEAMGD